MLEVNIVTPDNDLNVLTGEINHAAWDDGNEISPYDAEALRAYLGRADTLFVVCHSTHPEGRKFRGMASARFELKPYGHELWLYVDEVDVCADYRRKGVGKLIMQKLLRVASDRGCEELWLGADADNEAANALYESLQPDDVAEVVGYTFELTDED